MHTTVEAVQTFVDQEYQQQIDSLVVNTGNEYLNLHHATRFVCESVLVEALIPQVLTASRLSNQGQNMCAPCIQRTSRISHPVHLERRTLHIPV